MIPMGLGNVGYGAKVYRNVGRSGCSEDFHPGLSKRYCIEEVFGGKTQGVDMRGGSQVKIHWGSLVRIKFLRCEKETMHSAHVLVLASLAVSFGFWSRRRGWDTASKLTYLVDASHWVIHGRHMFTCHHVRKLLVVVAGCWPWCLGRPWP